MIFRAMIKKDKVQQIKWEIMDTMNIFGLEVDTSFIIASFSILLAIYSSIVAKKSAKYTRQSVLTTILLSFHKDYSSKEMNDAVSYLHQLKRDNEKAFSDNPYKFARDYISNTSYDSNEWQKRRMVSHFYSNLANLLDHGLVEDNYVFTLWGLDDLKIIKILEPIETAICEKTDSLPYKKEWPPLRLYEKAEKWDRCHNRKIEQKFSLPCDKYLYTQSNLNNDK